MRFRSCHKITKHWSVLLRNPFHSAIVVNISAKQVPVETVLTVIEWNQLISPVPSDDFKSTQTNKSHSLNSQIHFLLRYVPQILQHQTSNICGHGQLLHQMLQMYLLWSFYSEVTAANQDRLTKCWSSMRSKFDNDLTKGCVWCWAIWEIECEEAHFEIAHNCMNMLNEVEYDR